MVITETQTNYFEVKPLFFISLNLLGADHDIDRNKRLCKLSGG
jgi:hypothetical protein